MASVREVRRKLKDGPSGRKLVVLYDGQYFDVRLETIRTVCVKPEKAMEGLLDRGCYGIADDNDPEAFEVLAIE